VFYAMVYYSEAYGSLTDWAVGLGLQILADSVKKNVGSTFELNLSVRCSNAIETRGRRFADSHGLARGLPY